MKQRRRRTLVAFLLGAVAVYGYWLFSVLAAQGQGVLAQAPLNTQIQVEPAFIMAVDDSNSMTFERIFPGGDGRMRWNNSNSSFFDNNGNFHDVGTGCSSSNTADCYLYLFPHDGYNSSYSYGRAIPPLDAFGFARSPRYNASYFDPGLTYEPWKNADGSLWPNAAITAARADPRNPSSYGDSFKSAYDVVYDLTSNRAQTGERFSMLSGMSIPDLSGTGVRYRRRNSNNNGWTDSNWQSGARSFNGNRLVAFDYFPATYYLPANEPAPQGYRPGDAYRPVIQDACGPGCNLRRYQIKPGNYLTTEDYNREIQNFANWFQYHRSRLLAMVGALTHAMADVNNMRVGYFTINDRVTVNMRDLPADRSQLYSSFVQLQAGALVGKGGGTPSRDAVVHLGQQFERSGAGAPIKYSCQRNGGMLFTDGFTNSSNKVSGFGNVDQNLGAPFADNFSNTIADIAAAFYLDASEGGRVPLRTGSGFPAGQVPVPEACNTADPDPRLNCQKNLHMNFYGVTLGAKGNVFDVNQAATEDPFSTYPDWNAGGDPTGSDGAATIDEIWHATINSRGDFVNARTPADITDAMRRVLAAVAAGASTSGSVALTGERIGDGSLYVVPSYVVRNEGTDWHSTLTAVKVSLNDDREVVEEEIWEASARLPAASARGNRVWFGRSGGVERFNAANSNITWNLLCSNAGMAICTGAQASALGATLTEAVDYLLGDTSREVRNGGKLRDRGTRLGDIVNSTPVVSSPRDDYGYRWLPGAYGSSYVDYLEAKGSRNTMVYVGANDGMLHAFDSGMRADGSMASPSGNNGQEVFAYIPERVVGHLGNLLFPHNPDDQNNQKFQHRYYVDGPIVVSDAYYDGGWHTVLVGTTGAGGRSVFSLDVSNPGSFSAGDRLWEINDTHPTDSVRRNIGHVLGRPLIVPVKTSAGTVRWKAIFGNGYSSVDNKAVLFVVDVDNPANIHMIEAIESGATSPPQGMDNGLGNIIAVDRWGGDDLDLRVRDGFVDTVYGADQRGALWKFDLRALTGSGIKTSSIDTPLFVTQEYTDDGQKYRQPILGGLTAVASYGGRLQIIFGTGSFSFVGDAADRARQSIYAVLDKEDGSTVPLGDLHERRILSSANGARTIEGGPVPFGSGGWYINLPAGERVVGYPSILSGAVLVPTYTPRDDAGDGCSTSGLNWLFGLDARTGAAAMSDIRFGSPDGDTQAEGVGAIELDTRGTAPIRNIATMIIPPAELPEVPVCDPADPDCDEDTVPPPPAPPDEKCYARALAAGAPPMYRPYMCGRLSWRQIQ